MVHLIADTIFLGRLRARPPIILYINRTMFGTAQALLGSSYEEPGNFITHHTTAPLDTTTSDRTTKAAFRAAMTNADVRLEPRLIRLLRFPHDYERGPDTRVSFIVVPCMAKHVQLCLSKRLPVRQ